MRLFVVKDEKNPSDLRRALVKPDVPAARAKAVEDALRAANPLVDFGRLQPGTVLIVPDHDDVADAPARIGRVGPDFDAAAAALPVAVAAARRSAEESAKRTDTLHKALQGPEIRAAAGKDDRLRVEVERLTTAVADEQQRANEWAQAVNAQAERWRVALDNLKRTA